MLTWTGRRFLFTSQSGAFLNRGLDSRVSISPFGDTPATHLLPAEALDHPLSCADSESSRILAELAHKDHQIQTGR